ncbi:MAG TPA: MFS transporter [Gaiellaceae bacterium]|jgi:MFS family permease|nr:MFS transporter [Gaiellaceae bacterium]
MSLPLGALAERNFRLLFSSTTISGVGDGISNVALAFAVLQVSDSPISLGLVLAARQVANAGIVLAAGVWADRLPRQVILIAAAVVMGAAQTATGMFVLTGHATVWLLVVLQIVYGLADGFVIPASMGLIPVTISPARLQDANALLGLSQNGSRIIGPALGGALVAIGSPGAALLVDAGTFAAAAALLFPLRLPGRADVIESKPFIHELREGWGEFRRQTWLWTTIVFFGLGNFAFSSYFVLGPVVAKQDLGGAPAWAAMTTGFSVGSLLGGLVALRIRPRKPLAASCMAAWAIILQPLGLALGLPLWALVLCSAVAGIGLAVHLALWFTVFQQQVPAESMSRVSSYDAFGSFVLGPLGAALAGPVAAGIGVRETLLVAVGVIAVTEAIVFAQPSVHAIRAPARTREPEPETA